MMEDRGWNKMIIGENIDNYRISKKFTQMELAEMIDMDVRAVNRYCVGKTEPRATVLYKLAKALDCTVYDLLKGVMV